MKFSTFLTEATSAARTAITDCLAVLRANAKTSMIERGLVIDLRTGQRIFDELGSGEKVGIPNHIFNPTQHRALMHNHPPTPSFAPAPFSPGDWRTFALPGIDEMYVVSIHGTWVLKKGAKWNIGVNPEGLRMIYDQIMNEDISMYLHDHGLTEWEQIDSHVATEMIHHLNQAFAQKLGATYRKIA